jgi:hypothetical protein
MIPLDKLQWRLKNSVSCCWKCVAELDLLVSQLRTWPCCMNPLLYNNKHCLCPLVYCSGHSHIKLNWLKTMLWRHNILELDTRHQCSGAGPGRFNPMENPLHSVVAKALFYKQEGRGFDTRWDESLNLPNPSGFPQPLTKISARNIKIIMFLGSKVRRVSRADNLTDIREPIV